MAVGKKTHLMAVGKKTHFWVEHCHILYYKL